MPEYPLLKGQHVGQYILSASRVTLGGIVVVGTLLGCSTSLPQDSATSSSKTTPSADIPSKHQGKSAKRAGPDDVPSVTIGSTRYSVIHWARDRGLPQNGGYIAAQDVASGKELWILKVYSVKYDLAKEMDVQDIFIERMTVDDSGGLLMIQDETGRIFTVNPVSRAVRSKK